MEDECESDRLRSDRINTWAVALIVAIIALVLFVLFHTEGVSGFLKCEIPDPTARTVTVGLIIAGVIFLSIGVLIDTLEPVTDHYDKKSSNDNCDSTSCWF